MPAYAELQVASDFSFLHGASRAEEYVARAAQLGYSAIAITDECSLAGVVRAHVEAKTANLPLLIGSHFRLTAADSSPALAFTALAMNRDGYGNLCELVSLGRMRGKKGTYRLAPLDLEHPEAPFTHLRSRLRLANLYPAGALEETVRVARRCTFSLDDLKYEYPDEVVPAGYNATTYLREQTYIGARRRFPAGIPVDVQAQIEHELQLIADLKYEAYFLTVYDIVQFAREQGILCQGRGSAANSSVCYCLGVTEVDPSHQSMLFERFISKERNEPPDTPRRGVQVLPVDVNVST
ncbi:PHP domain protein [Burkholderia pseudomallei]|uniref:PHP domain protein n=1 Tax=Burkholderia pseudomallei TaxID=28450 RepID=A0AA40JIB2_BURPE|nr:PHP domain protein [Burkholderia pseudomallei]